MLLGVSKVVRMSFNASWKFLRLGNSSWDFLAVNFWSRDFLGGFDFCPYSIFLVTWNPYPHPPPPGLGLLLFSLSWACHLFIYFLFVCLFVCLFVWQCHPVVANRLHSRFQSWLSDWVKSNVTGDQEGRCRDWLLGKVDGLHPCTTTCEVVTSAAIEHNKYSVKWDKDKKDKQEATQNDSKESEQKAAS